MLEPVNVRFTFLQRFAKSSPGNASSQSRPLSNDRT